jgi:hypothetical protein
MAYTHLLECSDGLWLAYYADGRWIGRPAKRANGNAPNVRASAYGCYAIKARYKCDILASGVLCALPL